MVETVTSTTSLFCVFRSTFSDQVDPRAAGKEQVDLLEAWFARAEKAKSQLQADSPARISDVRYQELVADPIAAVEKIYDSFDMDLTPEAKASMLEHLEKEKKSVHGKHKYAPEQFGLDRKAIRERFAPYAEKYGLNGS